MRFNRRPHSFSPDIAWIRRIFDEKTRENLHIDFKSKHYEFGNEVSKKELAKDISAFANAEGGLLVIGIKSDEQGSPSELTPVILDEEIPKKYTRTIERLIHPQVHITIHEVPLEGENSLGYLILEIEISRMRPHAFLDGNSLSYRIRRGSECVPMTEQELRSEFEKRFTSDFFQIQFLRNLESEFIQEIDQNQNWLVLALSPEIKVDIKVSSESLEAFKFLIIKDYGIKYNSQYRYDRVHVGFRKFIATGMSGVSEPARFHHGHFHHNGSMIIGIALPNSISTNFYDERELRLMPKVVLEQSAIVKAALIMLEISMDFANFAQIHGDINYQLNLHIPSGFSYGVAHQIEDRSMPPLTGINKFSHSPALSTENINNLLPHPYSRNLLVRNLCSQLFQNFSIPECNQITESGKLDPINWSSGEVNAIRRQSVIESENT